MALSTWPEIADYLTRSQGIILPIGSTEQHGPTGLLGTDALCAEAVAAGVGQSLECLVGPTLTVGMAGHHMGFPGTITLQPTTLILVVRDVVLSLAHHGFRRFIFVNGHGGNGASLRAAFYEIYHAWRSEPALRCAAINWWENEPVARLARDLYGNGEGSHATPSEVALTQHLHPSHIKSAPLEPPQAPGGPIYDAQDFRRRYPDGRVGSNPGLATPEHGKRLLDTATSAVTHACRIFLSDP